MLCGVSACAQLGQNLSFGSPVAAAPGGGDGGGGSSGGGSYCGRGSYGKETAKNLHAWFDDADKGRHELHFIVKLHRALCSPDTAPADRNEIASMRATVLAELGLTDADTRDLPKLLDATTEDTPPNYIEYGERPSVKGEAHAASTDAIAQMYALHATNGFYARRWLIDAWGDTLTESARALYVHSCLGDASEKSSAAEKALAYAWCSDDAKHLDRAKLAREVASLPPEVRFVAKLQAGRLALEIAAFERALGKDPALAKIAIDQPRKIADDWRAFAKANAALVERVRAIELAWIDHHDESPADCRAALAGDWKRTVTAAKVEKASAPSLGIAASSRASYLASVGMVRCTRNLPGYAGLASMVSESLDRGPLARGPRTEAFEAAVVELAKTSKQEPHVPRMEAVDLSFLPIAQSNGHTARFWAHTVASMERHGDKIKFKFKKEKVDYAVCTREAPTGNWILHDNKLEREMHCVSLRSESTMEEVDPVELPADLTSWVKPGNAIVIGANDFPIEIWSDVHQTKLIGLYGTNRG